MQWEAIVTAAVAVLAYAVQWGVVTARLGAVEKRLDEFLAETRAVRSELKDLAVRISRLEGADACRFPHAGSTGSR